MGFYLQFCDQGIDSLHIIFNKYPLMATIAYWQSSGFLEILTSGARAFNDQAAMKMKSYFLDKIVNHRDKNGIMQ